MRCVPPDAVTVTLPFPLGSVCTDTAPALPQPEPAVFVSVLPDTLDRACRGHHSGMTSQCGPRVSRDLRAIQSC